MSEELVELRNSFEAYKLENNQKLDCLNSSIQEVVTVLKGGLGMPGMAGLVQKHDETLKQHEADKQMQRGVIATLSVIGGAVGSWIFNKILTGQAPTH